MSSSLPQGDSLTRLVVASEFAFREELPCREHQAFRRDHLFLQMPLDIVARTPGALHQQSYPVVWLISVSIERRTISPWSKSRTIDPNYVAALESMVAEAEAEVERLHTEIERLRSAVAASGPDHRAALYHKVGLNPGAPDWLILAARRAYRSALHPDRHPAWAKAEAERRFKLADRVFDEIAASRA